MWRGLIGDFWMRAYRKAKAGAGMHVVKGTDQARGHQVCFSTECHIPVWKSGLRGQFTGAVEIRHEPMPKETRGLHTVSGMCGAVADLGHPYLARGASYVQMVGRS